VLFYWCLEIKASTDNWCNIDVSLIRRIVELRTYWEARKENLPRRDLSRKSDGLQPRRTFRPLHLEGRKLYQETRQLSCREEKSCSAKARNTRHATNRNPIIRAIRHDRLVKSPGITFARGLSCEFSPLNENDVNRQSDRFIRSLYIKRRNVSKKCLGFLKIFYTQHINDCFD